MGLGDKDTQAKILLCSTYSDYPSIMLKCFYEADPPAIPCFPFSQRRNMKIIRAPQLCKAQFYICRRVNSNYLQRRLQYVVFQWDYGESPNDSHAAEHEKQKRKREPWRKEHWRDYFILDASASNWRHDGMAKNINNRS